MPINDALTASPQPLLTLDYLTVSGAGPVEFVDIAADADFAAISLIGQGNDLVPAHRLAVGDPQTEAMVGRLAERGLFVNNVDGFYVTGQMDWDDIDRLVAVSRHIGAARAVAMVFDSEQARARDAVCLLAEKCTEVGLGLAIEPAPLSALASLADAARLTDGMERSVGLIADSMHLLQAGDTPEIVASFVDRVVGGQIADAPSGLSAEQYGYDAIYERLAPGDGDLPLRAFLEALPRSASIGIEIPQASLAARGITHVDRVRDLKRKTVALLAAIGRY